MIGGGYDRRRRRLSGAAGLFENPTTAKVVLIMAVGLTATAWFFSNAAVDSARQDRFEFRTREIENAIDERMKVYEQLLWGGVAVFNGSEGVTRSEWAEFVATFDLDEHWPGIQGMGYAVPIEPGDLDAHVAEIRAEGFPDYTVTPVEPRDEYTAIVYLEPFDWRNKRAFGYDMWSNAIRREAMARARDRGEAATSGIITLVQETDDDVQRGFLTYVPVYSTGSRPDTVAERRALLEGWIYAPFRINDLMAGILGSGVPGVNYQIFDGEPAPENLLFESADSLPDDGAGRSDLLRTSSFDTQGRQWTLTFHSTPDFATGAESILPKMIAIGGVVINLLLFAVITSLGQLNRRAVALAREMTSELRIAKEAVEQRSEQLELQAKQLRRSNAELGQFAFIASHDLQEPLRNLQSYSGLLTERFGDSLTEEGNRWVGYIGTAANRMSELIRELLDYSKIDTCARELAPVDLNEVVAQAITNLERELESTGAAIELSQLPTVEGSRLQLERLFQNLLANATKYRSEEAPRIVVGCSDDGRAYRVTVQDNGIGIKPEYQDRIFEIFRRVDSKTCHPGAGIGLAVCRKVVDSHGGEMGVDSTPGEGSTFWFTIPHSRLIPGVLSASREQAARAPVGS